jgi:hypothetical protein
MKYLHVTKLNVLTGRRQLFSYKLLELCKLYLCITPGNLSLRLSQYFMQKCFFFHLKSIKLVHNFVLFHFISQLLFSFIETNKYLMNFTKRSLKDVENDDEGKEWSINQSKIYKKTCCCCCCYCCYCYLVLVSNEIRIWKKCKEKKNFSRKMFVLCVFLYYFFGLNGKATHHK